MQQTPAEIVESRVTTHRNHQKRLWIPVLCGIGAGLLFGVVLVSLYPILGSAGGWAGAALVAAWGLGILALFALASFALRRFQRPRTRG